MEQEIDMFWSRIQEAMEMEKFVIVWLKKSREGYACLRSLCFVLGHFNFLNN